ncbi:MAG: cation diffusion facilitator family transporter [Prevotellaceae bacterium]|jgi:cobalt-zinc-cadmium efflux system protein|nr:cation diffusion facilitator family transporter [Prevotellaceae bacterium]
MTHSHSGDHNAGKNIKMAFFLNLAFSVIEVVGGAMTHSIAILSDALHDFGDSFSLALAWYFQKVSRKKRDAKYSYGYRRFSLLGALINSVVLLLGSFFVIYESVQRLVAPQAPDAKGMLALAVAGIVVNGLAMLRLRRGGSLNERTVSLHLLEDVLGWAAVLVGSVVMIFVDVPVLDPILSLGIACYILFNIYHNLRDTLRVVLQGTPENVSCEAVETALQSLDGVKSLHDLHLWTLDGEYNISSLHVVVAPGLSGRQIITLKQQIKSAMRNLNIRHVTLEIEQEEEGCALKDES